MNAAPLFLALALAALTPAQAAESPKPRVIITQDGEIDDRSSFTRFLLYTADMDLRGVIATNSKWQPNGHGLGWIHETYERYGQVRENLLRHKSGYPTVDYLRSITVLGNENPEHLTGAAPYADTPGSNLIVEEMLRSEDTLLHVNCWGGINTVAQALWRCRNDHPQAYAERVSNIRIFAIDFQDEAGSWIRQNAPEVQLIRCQAFHMTWNYHSPEKPLEHNPFPQLMSERWLRANVKTNHGPLTAAYPLRNVSEGDTPAFLNLIDNGLRAYENPDFGGWGGRYRPSDGNFWIDAPDDNSRHKSLWRWVPAAQNDFAARADWCVKTFDDANHPPVIESAIQPAAVKPGQTVELSADGSDPDGDAVHYFWWHYPDPSGMTEPLPIDHETAREARFVVPENASGAIHIILELSDDGEPILRRYRRLVFPVVR